MRGLPDVTYCTLTHQSSENWGRHVKQHTFLYQLWTIGSLLNILLGAPNHDSQNSLDETHELGSWAWTMGFDMFLCKYGLFWALEEIFSKSMIMLMWCGSPMKWSHVVWKICPQHPLTWNIYPWSFVMWNVKLVKKNKQGNQHTYEWTQKVLIVSFFLQLRLLECSKWASASSKFSFYRSEKVSGKIPAHKWGEMRT